MDNRLQFPISSEVDFDEVGYTGQDHDIYPAFGTESRYDWMKSYILGLLSNQASNKKPAEYRPGTIHYSLETFFFECVRNNDFESIAGCIKIMGDNLGDWAEQIEEKRQRFQPSGTFSGVAYASSSIINIPNSLQEASKAPNKPYLFKNGKIVDPSLVYFNTGCPVAIELSGNAVLNADDVFVVFIKQ